MKMNTRKLGIWRTVWLMASVVLAIVGTCGAARATLAPADLWITDASGAAEVTQPSPGEAVISFTAGFGTPGDAVLQPSSTDPSRLFVGDYAAARVASIVFKLKALNSGGLPDRTHIEFLSGVNLWVSYNLSVLGTGQVTTNQISMDRAAGGWILWTDPSLGADAANAQWNRDVHNITSIKLCVPKGFDQAKTYVVSDFALDGSQAVQAMTPLVGALIARFGVGTVEEISQEDAAYKSPGELMTDLEKILAAYVPGYELLKLTEGGPDGFTIYWNSEVGRQYSLLRAEMADGPYDTVLVDGATASGTTMWYTDLDSVQGIQYFYKLIRH
jgi:hypothetical protein